MYAQDAGFRLRVEAEIQLGNRVALASRPLRGIDITPRHATRPHARAFTHIA